MNKFLSEELYNEVDDLIERLDRLRDTLVDARDAKDYEDFSTFMDDAYQDAQIVCYDVDSIRGAGSVLYEDDEDEDDEYRQSFLNALNNYIKAHR